MFQHCRCWYPAIIIGLCSCAPATDRLADDAIQTHNGCCWKPTVGYLYSWEDACGFRRVEVGVVESKATKYRIWVKRTSRHYESSPGFKADFVPVPGHGRIQLAPGHKFHEESVQEIVETRPEDVVLLVVGIAPPEEVTNWVQQGSGWSAEVRPHKIRVYHPKGKVPNLVSYTFTPGRASPSILELHGCEKKVFSDASVKMSWGGFEDPDDPNRP